MAGKKKTTKVIKVMGLENKLLLENERLSKSLHLANLKIMQTDSQREKEKYLSKTIYESGKALPSVPQFLINVPTVSSQVYDTNAMPAIPAMEGKIAPSSTTTDPNNYTFKNGAKSTSKVIRMDFLPRTFLERVAKRFELGAVTKGDFNYRKGFSDEEFILDRINHLQVHLQAFLNPQNKAEFEDDQLAAMGWAIAFLMEAQATARGKRTINEIISKHGKNTIITADGRLEFYDPEY